MLLPCQSPVGIPPYQYEKLTTQATGILQIRNNGRIVLPSEFEINTQISVLEITVSVEDSSQLTNYFISTLTMQVKGVGPHQKLSIYYNPPRNQGITLQELGDANFGSFTPTPVVIVDPYENDGHPRRLLKFEYPIFNDGVVFLGGDLSLFFQQDVKINLHDKASPARMSLKITDHDNTPEERIRPDRVYIIDFDSAENIQAEFVDNASPEPNILTGNITISRNEINTSFLVASVRASHGDPTNNPSCDSSNLNSAECHHYTYGVETNDVERLSLNSWGGIYIPPEIRPALDEGKTLSMKITVNDKSNGNYAASEYTDPVILSLTVTYRYPMELYVTDVSNQIMPEGNFSNTVYVPRNVLHRGLDKVRPFPLLFPNMTIALISMSAGMPPYAYRKVGENSTLMLKNNKIILSDNIEFINDDDTLYPITMTIGATDANGYERLLTLNLTIDPINSHARHLMAICHEVAGCEDPNQQKTLTVSQGTITIMVPELHAADYAIMTVLDQTFYLNEGSGDDSLRVIRGDLLYKNKSSAHGEILIPGYTEPLGQLMSIVLLKTDGDDASAEWINHERARPDKLYTVYVRYIQQISVVMKNQFNQNANNPIIINSPSGRNVFVASVFATGGTSQLLYNLNNNRNLDGAFIINSDGVITIPDLSKLAINEDRQLIIRVRDSGTGRSNSKRVTITVRVQSEPIPLELTASDHRGEVVEGGNFAGKGITYVTQEQIYRGFSSTDTTLAYLGASGGTPGYSYAIISAQTKVTIQENIIILAQGFVVPPGQSRLQITVQVTDKNRPAPNTTRLTLRFKISRVIQHPHLNGFVLPVTNTLVNNFDGRINIFRQPAPSPETLTAIVVNVHNRTAIRKIGGDLEFEKRITSTHPGEIPYANQYNILIPANISPTGNTLSIVLRVTDGDGLIEGRDAQSRRARP